MTIVSTIRILGYFLNNFIEWIIQNNFNIFDILTMTFNPIILRRSIMQFLPRNSKQLNSINLLLHFIFDSMYLSPIR